MDFGSCPAVKYCARGFALLAVLVPATSGLGQTPPGVDRSTAFQILQSGPGQAETNTWSALKPGEILAPHPYRPADGMFQPLPSPLAPAVGSSILPVRLELPALFHRTLPDGPETGSTVPAANGNNAQRISTTVPEILSGLGSQSLAPQPIPSVVEIVSAPSAVQAVPVPEILRNESFSAAEPANGDLPVDLSIPVWKKSVGQVFALAPAAIPLSPVLPAVIPKPDQPLVPAATTGNQEKVAETPNGSSSVPANSGDLAVPGILASGTPAMAEPAGNAVAAVAEPHAVAPIDVPNPNDGPVPDPGAEQSGLQALSPLPADSTGIDFVPAMLLAPLASGERQITLMPLLPEAAPHPNSTAESPETAPLLLREFRNPGPAERLAEGPIELRAVHRLTSLAYGNQGRDFTVAEMTGPLGANGNPFENLNLESSYRAAAVLDASEVRPVWMNGSLTGYWQASDYTWISPVFAHGPLYFEQANLERYGIRQRPLFEPFLSAADFFGTAALMPLKVVAHNPCSNVYTLGNQRPGDCAAFQYDPRQRCGVVRR